MKCRKCKAEIPNDSKFCMMCGAKQSTKQRTKGRGNGQGSVYQLPNKTWIAIKTIGYKAGADGKAHRITRSKSGFKTKREAVEYLPLLTASKREKAITFQQLYETWFPTHQASKSTRDCYAAAMKYYEPLWYTKIQEITVDDLQECIDDCPKGKRTRENMKTLCGLLYKYAIPRNLAELNMGEYIKARGGEHGKKDGLPIEAVEAIANYVGKVKGADYVLCQCYLGFRPSEFLALDAKNYNRKERAFVGGAKTDAGRDRIVTISPKIQPIVDRLVKNKISGPVFCAKDGAKMGIAAYRSMFYDVLEKCGIENPTIEKDGDKRKKYTPHSCRHTFATLMKRVDGSDKDKLELMGHTSTEMLRHYQDTPFEDLRRITDAL
ncbi:tyrosine-type recombinase/integrase [Candidatus Agathobaculum pullicola]|uniref:tyrosine-type recombinase/integrase n=1 Tax=Candidatus Agathobaculum pullicola TaxID=2838426 RepID=UPI003F8F45FF